VALGDAATLDAGPAGNSGPFQAVDPLGQLFGQGHLTHMGRAHQQVSVGQPALLQAGLKLPENVVLSVNLPHHQTRRYYRFLTLMPGSKSSASQRTKFSA
jgi:hypothetical protein